MYSNLKLFVFVLVLAASPVGLHAKSGSGSDWQRLEVKQNGRSKCHGDKPYVCIRPQDELWIVSARDAHCDASGFVPLHCSRFVDGGFCPAELQALYTAHQTDHSRQTVLFVHGNRTDAGWATSRGAQVYENIFASNLCSAPVRYVIWQWRSEPEIKRPIRDYVIKSQRAVRLGPSMARFLRDFEDREIMLIGYSLGSQVLLSAFSNGCMADFPDGRGYSLNFIAAAIDCDFARTVGCLGCPLQLVDQTNIFQNDGDRVVRASQKVCQRRFGRCVSSLASIVQQGLLALGEVSMYNITNEVGKQHSVVRYTRSMTVRTVIAAAVEQRLEGQDAPPAEQSVLEGSGDESNNQQ